MTKLTTSQNAYAYLRRMLRSDVEELWVVALNSDKSVRAISCLFRGTVDACLFHPRDIFRFACLQNATAILVAHNHPTGDPEPSEQDIEITAQLIAAAKLMQIPLIDHLVIGRSSYVSFRDRGMIASEYCQRR